ncbi:MAG: aspartate aminotransferase family protein [Gammaproteobacteria bacterium]|nr:MAG: aspartate aminotransferase family protein [Gammaproteobacteria bacterium]
MKNTIMSTYNRLPVSFSHGQGAYLYDTEGKEYLDALAGIAVCGLGHAHPELQSAIADQAGKLLHTSNLYSIELQQQLADELTALSGMDAVFFSNSGAEANEAAIKLARLYGHHKKIAEPAIIVMEHSFHGRTMATLSATGNRRVQAGFEPLVKGFIRVPYNDAEAVRQVAANYHNVVAILVEPIQGEVGIVMPKDNYLNELRAICDEQDWLLMLDEIQTGMGRTGQWFAFQHNSIQPDVMTLAKALGNGVPIGACLARGEAAKTFTPGTHGSTFGGNPLACRAALSVIEVMKNGNLVNNAEHTGQYLLDSFRDRLAHTDGIVEIRGKGLMIAIELDRGCTELVTQALNKNLLINVASGKTIRLLPPLIIEQQQAEAIVNTVCDLVVEFLEQGS